MPLFSVLLKGLEIFVFFSSHHLAVDRILNHFTYRAKFSCRHEQNVSSLWRQIYGLLFRSSDLFTCLCYCFKFQDCESFPTLVKVFSLPNQPRATLQNKNQQTHFTHAAMSKQFCFSPLLVTTSVNH